MRNDRRVLYTSLCTIREIFFENVVMPKRNDSLTNEEKKGIAANKRNEIREFMKKEMKNISITILRGSKSQREAKHNPKN